MRYKYKKSRPAWSAERIARLTVLWGEGLSASQISDDLGGTTRNAVIGKANRLKLLPRKPRISIRPKRKPRKQHPANEKPSTSFYDFNFALSHSQSANAAESPTIGTPPPQGGPLPLLISLDKLSLRSCRWPYGASHYLFCGRHAEFGHSYCPQHEAMSTRRA